MTASVLTAAVVEKFLKDPGSVDLDEYTDLDSQAAAALATSKLDISLNGLQEISEEAALALVSHAGGLSIEGLKRLSVAAAQALAQHVGPLRGVDLLRFVDKYPVFSALRRHPSLVAYLLEDSRFFWILKSKDVDLTDADGAGFPFADREDREYFDRGYGYEGIPTDDGVEFVVKAGGLPLWRVPLPEKDEGSPSAGWGAPVLYFIGDREDVLRRLGELPNRVLTKTIAKKWAKDSGSVDLSCYGELSDDAASILARTSEDMLELNLNTLSESVAKSLAEVKGDLLLHGITPLTERAAAALAKHRGGVAGNVLDLCGVKEFEDGAVEALGSHEGPLMLGLTALSDEAANALSRREGELYLPNLTSLSDVAAAALARHKGELSLRGEFTLSDTAAAALAKHRGALDLVEVSTISDAAAAAFATHRGTLDLSGLDTLSDAAAVALAKHEGELRLSGLTTLSDAALNCLRANPQISLPSTLGK